MVLILAISLAAVITQPVYAAMPECQRCVAFRLDDIQDYYYSSEQRAIIEMFMRNNASLTIGVIGAEFGQDKELIDFVRQYKNDSRLEIANHGWLHEDFGQTADAAIQQELIERTNLKIHDILGQDVVITTFIPPFNSINEQTYEAVENSGLHVISADARSDVIFSSNQTASSALYHLPMTAEGSIYFSNSSSWRAVSALEILEKIHDSVRKNGNAVVMLHPWDSIDTIKSVITRIHESTDYRIVTLREMAFGQNQIPEGLNVAILAVLLACTFIATTQSRRNRST
ncbi:MAG: polysaccharide deacetylase family protein [Nitrososphaera sp.]